MGDLASGFVLQAQKEPVCDCRGQEIELGCKVVVAGDDGSLFERTVVWIDWIEWIEPGRATNGGWVVQFKGGDYAAPEKCAVVGLVLTPGTIPEDASLVVLRTDEILPRDKIEEVKDVAQRHFKRDVVVVAGFDCPLEWWTDEMLASVGLQRTPAEGTASDLDVRGRAGGVG